jgi:hypothetical protein
MKNDHFWKIEPCRRCCENDHFPPHFHFDFSTSFRAPFQHPSNTNHHRHNALHDSHHHHRTLLTPSSTCRPISSLCPPPAKPIGPHLYSFRLLTTVQTDVSSPISVPLAQDVMNQHRQLLQSNSLVILQLAVKPGPTIHSIETPTT